MVNNDVVFSVPIDQPLYEGSGLFVPLVHLLGRKISIEPKTTPVIDVAAWTFDKRKTQNIYDGRIHIWSPFYEDLSLIEDFIGLEKLPQDFPIVSERATHSGLVVASLYYPRSNQNWNFHIHLKYTGKPREGEVRPNAEERLRKDSQGIFRRI